MTHPLKQPPTLAPSTPYRFLDAIPEHRHGFYPKLVVLRRLLPEPDYARITERTQQAVASVDPAETSLLQMHIDVCSEQSQAGVVGRGDQSHTLTRY